MKNEFWKTKSLQEMDKVEWEMLCDHCGRCCMFKLEDSDTGEIFYTNVVCKLLDVDTCSCTNYKNRRQIIRSCICLSPGRLREMKWLPDTCAYKRLNRDLDLESWHPLISGNYVSVLTAGISVAGKVISENHVDMSKLEDFIIDWIDYNQL